MQWEGKKYLIIHELIYSLVTFLNMCKSVTQIKVVKM